MKSSAIWDMRVLVDEEPQVSPTFAIFLDGCSLGCRFCMAYEHSRPTTDTWARRGPWRSPPGPDRPERSSSQDLVRELRSLLAEASRMQVKTVSLLGGEPSSYLAEIREAQMAARRDGVPVPPVALNATCS